MKQVTIYTSPTCQYCHALRIFLQEKKVRYKEYDVTRNHAAAQDMIEKSHQLTVPVIDVGGTIIIGFDRARLEAALQ